MYVCMYKTKSLPAVFISYGYLLWNAAFYCYECDIIKFFTSLRTYDGVTNDELLVVSSFRCETYDQTTFRQWMFRQQFFFHIIISVMFKTMFIF
jgi:hypothetical protein